jgi:hypothetical protein
MRRGICSRGIFILLLICIITVSKTGSLYAAYDSTYVMAVTQKFAIPENILQGDYVGTWQKTFTWFSSGSISFSIERNYKNAFSIDSRTGLITISDAKPIDGKIIRQDTIVNLVIRTTDSKEGFELDTAQIRIKNKDFVVFIDFGYKGGSENGTREKPYSNCSSSIFKKGMMVAFKRNQVTTGRHMWINGLHNSADNPDIICAYGKGKKPEFNGTDVDSRTEGWILGDEANQVAGRVENLYFYDIVMRNYASCAYNVYRTSKNIGWYNCETYNCDKDYVQSPLVICTSSYDDSVAVRPFELINYISDTTAINKTVGNHIKIGVGPTKLINCMFGKSPESAVRFASGNNSSMQHCLIQTGVISEDYWNNAVQVRGDGITLEDCRILGSGSSIMITSAADELEMQPDRIVVRNCYLKNAVRGISISPPDDAYKQDIDCLFEDNYIVSCEIGIRLKNDVNTMIRRNKIVNSTTNGIYTNGNCMKLKVFYNIIDDMNKEAIALTNGNGALIYNNTVFGTINLTGASNTIVRNNFFQLLTNAGVESNNINIRDIDTQNYFTGYSNRDFRLKSTAEKAINKGSNVGLDKDYEGKNISGIPDIGALEYVSSNSNNTNISINTPPVILDQQFVIRQQDFTDLFVSKVIAFDKDEGQKIKYTITEGNGTGLFILDASSGDLKTNRSNVFGSDRSVYDIVVKVTDNGNSPLSTSAKITVTFMGASATVHIDPDNANDPLENGSLDHPYNSWQKVAWNTGNVYLQKSGTTAKVDKIVIGADNVSFGSYGEGDKPIIVSETNTYLISGFEKKNISMNNLYLKSLNAVSCIYFLGNTCDNIVIENCTLEGVANAIRIADGQKFIFRYNTISGENEGISSTAAVLDVYYNIFKSNQVGIHITNSLSKANIFNNIFVGNGESVSASYGELTLFNNIFYMTDPGQKAWLQVSDQITSDHNIYFPEQDGFIEYAGKIYHKLDQLQQSLKLDLNSFTSDPVFMDVYNDNFKLNSFSPAIDAGINVNLTRDFFGTDVPGGGFPDIGIFENAGGIPKQSETGVQKTELIVYPNPSKGYINVDVQLASPETATEGYNTNRNSTFKVVDISGNTLLTRLVELTENTVHENFDLSNLSNGLYTIIFDMVGKPLTKKLILNH